ncbi:hypothetical protein KEM52_002981 [Ascosphaera acerosa]|nr:hypothetical protein KEM52_002981 [Ascosphaera acerosa]
MSVHVSFDRQRLSYSTYDTVSGTVHVRLPVPTTVSAISVKLEGEANTTLAPNTGDRRKDKKNTASEVHKVLYYVQTVFPAPEIQRCSAPGATWTISPGRYDFPFSFKLPYWAECIKNAQTHTNNFGDLLLDNNRDMYNNSHIRAQLPPSFNAPQDPAHVVYFVKCTVTRPAFYQSNYRALSRITLIPNENPRPEPSGDETYARRQYAFGTSVNRSRSLAARLTRKGEPVVDSPGGSGDQPSFCVDARVPAPALLTCNRPVPLRVVLKKLNDSAAPLYLTSLDVELIGHTDMRARTMRRVDAATWSVVSHPQLSVCVADGNVTAGTEWELDPSYWNHAPVPDVVAPSFVVCNIARTYELQVRLGFANGPAGAPHVQVLNPSP